MNLYTLLLDLLFPPRTTDALARCVTVIPSLAPRTLRIRDLDVVVLLPYRDPLVRALVLETKYHNHKEATAALASTLTDYLLEALPDATALERRAVTILPIPLSENRHRNRGYNQVARMCEQASRALSLPMDTSLLVRVRDTAPQTRLGKAARHENVRDAFAVTRSLDPERLYVLVDDVLTTGATLRSAETALRKAGAVRIMAIALAH